MNTKAIGELSEGVILAHLLRKGWAVSLPFGNNQRYDMIVDTGDKLLRAQCKTGRYLNGCVEFATSSKNGFTGERLSYAGQIEVFLVYSPATEAVYMFPADQAPPTFVRIRVEPARGGSKSNIRWAKDFEI
jgi:hypothetical protein